MFEITFFCFHVLMFYSFFLYEWSTSIWTNESIISLTILIATKILINNFVILWSQFYLILFHYICDIIKQHFYGCNQWFYLLLWKDQWWIFHNASNSVLPTPVGPRNTNEPIGRFSLPIPLRLRRTARETALSASCWPMTYLVKVFSSVNKYLASERITFFTGTPVMRATTSAKSSLVSTNRFCCLLPSSNFVSSSFIWLARVLNCL